MRGANLGRHRARRASLGSIGRCAIGVALLASGLLQHAGAASPLAEGVGAVPDLERLLARPGAALRAGVEAMQRGEPFLAEALLAAVAARHPVVADHADLLRMQLRVDTGRYRDAIEFRNRWSHAESPLATDFYTALGRAYAAVGEEANARASWDFAARATTDRERRAEIELSIAESFEREGLGDATVESFLAIWSQYPDQPASEVADQALERLERERGRDLRTAEAVLRRADALLERRHNEEALAAYDRALALGLPSASSREAAQNARAETLFRLRRYTEAAAAFAALPPSDERRLQRARAVARAGDVAAGARALEKLGNDARSRQATRALLLAGMLFDGEGETAHAHKLFQEVIERDAQSSYAAAARWRLGWSDFREGRYADAIVYFQALEADDDDPVGALRPRYWQIRANELLGIAGTTEQYRALARDYPLSYYGWRAQGRAGSDDSERSVSEVRAGRTALAPSQLARPRILLEAGLVDLARLELDRLFRRARGIEDRLALAQLYANAGDFHRPQQLMVDAYTERLAQGPVPDQLELWWHAWPAPFEEEMRDATQNGQKIEPELVYAIMREESGYRTDVVSISGARGLLQLMPDTARRVAEGSQRGDFSVEDLFVPRINIELGADYLATLLRRFDGRASAAIGSYNAGPRVVARWISDTPAADDIWVEEIPYDQTRSYVKRVLRSLQAYRVLY
jgi:peptidoglycan lytic transglycosylase